MDEEQETMPREEAMERVRQVLSAMAATALAGSPRTLAALNLRLLGMSVTEISRRLGIGRCAVYRHLRRAAAISPLAAEMLRAVSPWRGRP